MASISLVSVNIERSKHLDSVSDFISARNSDVVCMQELCERDIAHFEISFGMQCVFAPEIQHPADAPETGHILVGSGIFSRPPIVERNVEYYVGSKERAETNDVYDKFRDVPLVMCDVEKDGAVFRFATTHFTWTPNGSVSDAQRENIQALLVVLASSGEFVLTGDFNAPRGDEIFSALAEKYTDNIPVQYTTSIDATLHRAGPLPYMVDGLFTTSVYSASDVVLHTGVSDHCAITATITRG